MVIAIFSYNKRRILLSIIQLSGIKMFLIFRVPQNVAILHIHVFFNVKVMTISALHLLHCNKKLPFSKKLQCRTITEN
jgi:hypothetical protein